MFWKVLTNKLRRRASAVMAIALVALLALPSAYGQTQILDVHEALPDLDTRTGIVAPSAAQLALASGQATTVRWNMFGTPQSLINYGNYLATGLSGDPVTVARDWIRANRTLFRLSDQGVSDLELLNDSLMSEGKGHAVIFRQRFDKLPAAQDGMIIVGVTGDKIFYASSSSVGDQAPPGQPALSATTAWLNAASNVGHAKLAANIAAVRQENDWTVFDVAGFSHPQRARLVAFPTPTQGVRPAYETIVLNVQGGEAIAYKSFVDAQTGAVLFRQNAVQQFSTHKTPPAAPQTGTYQGSTGANGQCGPDHPFNVPAGTKSIELLASAINPADDIVLNLVYNGVVVASADTLFSPEAIHYEPTQFGTYAARVCPFLTDVPGFEYAGAFATNDVAGSSAFAYPPKWKAFPANPPLNLSNSDTRKVWCWVSSISGTSVPGCQFEVGNTASRAPWDHDVRLNSSTFTTKGNNASSAQAWLSPLTPAEQYRPISPNREYIFPWTNAWNKNKCSPTVFTPQGNDIDAAITNLFAMHNRMHDWSYFLGFTEGNFNMQENNFGNSASGPFPVGRENDPETGNAQAGAVTGGAPSYLGRDNANQITLNDGIPGITNMYLWQPIAAAFYAPCVDGDYDMSVIGHEYTHATSNRMVGGPDANLTGPQAGAMGESWSDLNAVEYLHEYGFVPTNGENPFAVGSYVTGNHQSGIRNYGMNASPLNYSDIGYDMTGVQVHADGEIWSATNYQIRQALIAKYNGQFPASNAQLQKDCADGKRPADQCPGNRRWIQIVHDAWLLMQPAVSMLDARDAYLAADLMRFGGANQVELWKAFAQRGMGASAVSNTNADGDPKPAFDAPVGPAEATATFVLKDEKGNPVGGKVFVGQYQARSTPAADTVASTALGNQVKIMPGSYDFVLQADGYGMQRLTRTFSAGKNVTVNVVMPTNHASKSKGATAVASSEAPNPPDPTFGPDAETNFAVNAIDDTEATNWTGIGQMTADQSITIDLAGSAPVTIKQVNVSAMLRPAVSTSDLAAAGQNRFTALRKFRLEVSINGVTFTPVFTSPDAAFPAKAPRPTAPDLILRSFVLSSPVQATHLRLVADTNQCQGGPAYQGDQDNDPQNNSDCTTGSPSQANRIRVAEVQVFSVKQ